MILFYYILYMAIHMVSVGLIILVGSLVSTTLSTLSLSITGVTVVLLATIFGLWILPYIPRVRDQEWLSYSTAPWDEKWHVTGIALATALFTILLIGIGL